MTATIAQLGARALRKLGVAIVADASRQPSGTPATSFDVVARVLRDMGITTTEAERPASLAAVSADEPARRALRMVGANPIAGVASSGIAIGVAEIASRALRDLGANPADMGAPLASGITMDSAALGTAVLLKLSVIASDETPSITDQAYVVNRVLAVHDELVALDYVTWPVTAVPLAATEFYVIMAATLAAAAFDKQPNMDAYKMAQEAIRQQALSGPVAATRAQARVQTVHDALVDEGLADWSINAIPDSMGDAYVGMVMTLLAPVYDNKPPDIAVYERWANHVRRLVLSGARGQAIAVAKVQAVHEEANALGLVWWTVDQIPVAFVEDYARMAAIRLAGVYDTDTPQEKQVDAAPYEEAMGHLRRAGMVRMAAGRALDKVTSVHAELNELGLVTWDLYAIPASMVDAYAGMATMLMQPEGGKPEDPGAYAAQMQRVRMLVMGGPAGQALAEQKVRAVHYSLDARGRTRWTLFDVPDYAEEPYVLMTATLLAPEVGVKADSTWEMRAEVDLMRIVSVPSNNRPVVGHYF